MLSFNLLNCQNSPSSLNLSHLLKRQDLIIMTWQQKTEDRNCILKIVMR